MLILQLSHWKFSHTNFVANYSTEVKFIQKTKKSLFSHPLEDLGATHALHL